VVDVIHEFRSYGMKVFVHDPVADRDEAKHEYGLELVGWQDLPVADATVLAVAHRALLKRPIADFAAKTVRGGCIADVKSKLDAAAVQAHGLKIWRL
jgi:UDP-N-acetyl-D-galactosamine dehydrogenase